MVTPSKKISRDGRAGTAELGDESLLGGKHLTVWSTFSYSVRQAAMERRAVYLAAALLYFANLKFPLEED
jgi:hypothetical protein